MEPSEKPRPKVGVGVVVIQDKKVLLGKRKGSHGAGTWAFAGGHLEFGEDLHECVMRELMEETGLKALSVHPGSWTNDIIDGKHYITLFGVVDHFEGEVKLAEPEKCEEWNWFPWDDLPSPLFPSVASLIDKVGLEAFAKIGKKENVYTLLAALFSFYREREWEKFHSPKNLVINLASEVGELLEPFRWITEEQSHDLDPATLENIKDEIGDVFSMLTYLSYKLGINPIRASFDKLAKTELKYPVDLCKGKPLKYTAYDTPKNPDA